MTLLTADEKLAVGDLTEEEEHSMRISVPGSGSFFCFFFDYHSDQQRVGCIFNEENIDAITRRDPPAAGTIFASQPRQEL